MMETTPRTAQVSTGGRAETGRKGLRVRWGEAGEKVTVILKPQEEEIAGRRFRPAVTTLRAKSRLLKEERASGGCGRLSRWLLVGHSLT